MPAHVQLTGGAICQVDIKGVDGELRKTAQEAMHIRPNFAYTAAEVQEDVRRVFACGFFAKLTPIAEDTRDGVKLTMEVCALLPPRQR